MHVSGTRRRAGFSLVELSVVIVIISIVAVMGLEATAMFLNRTAYQTTTEKLAVIDKAMVDYARQYARLPCPARRNIGPSISCAGKENRGTVPGNCLDYTNPCVALLSAVNTLYYGNVPVRDLGLPTTYMFDAYGNKFSYVVSSNMVITGTGASQFSNAASTDQIVVRSGKIDDTCSTTGKLCQTRGTAAYFLFSSGRDKRGAFSKEGVQAVGCDPTDTANDARIDSANCRFANTATTTQSRSNITPVAVPSNVLYDSRFNAGGIEENFFDDVVKWRPKNGL